MKKIYIQTWLTFKPYEQQVPSDSYYLKLANLIQKNLAENTHWRSFAHKLNPDIIIFSSCMLASYIEDLVSGTNLWTSFVELHKKAYGKPLPFYDCSEYYEGEVNEQDIAFLLWYIQITYSQDFFKQVPLLFFEHSAKSTTLKELSKALLPLLEDAWEEAPENKQLKANYWLSKDEKSPLNVQFALFNLATRSYLFNSDLRLYFAREVMYMEDDPTQDFETALSDLIHNVVFEKRTALLASKVQDFLALMLGEKHPLSKDVAELKKYQQDPFLVKEEREDSFLLKHIWLGQELILSKQSIDKGNLRILRELAAQKTVGVFALHYWRNQWLLPEAIQDYGHNYESFMLLESVRGIPSKYDKQFLKTPEQKALSLDMQKQVFHSISKGKNHLIVKASTFNTFFNKLQKAYFDLLDVKQPKKEDKTSIARAIYSHNATTLLGLAKEEMIDKVFVYFNPKEGLEFCEHLPELFKKRIVTSNINQESLLSILALPEYSPSLISYCMKEFPKAFEKLEAENIPPDDFDFMLRLIRSETYYEPVLDNPLD